MWISTTVNSLDTYRAEKWGVLECTTCTKDIWWQGICSPWEMSHITLSSPPGKIPSTSFPVPAALGHIGGLLSLLHVIPKASLTWGFQITQHNHLYWWWGSSSIAGNTQRAQVAEKAKDSTQQCPPWCGQQGQAGIAPVLGTGEATPRVLRPAQGPTLQQTKRGAGVCSEKGNGTGEVLGTQVLGTAGSCWCLAWRKGRVGGNLVTFYSSWKELVARSGSASSLR